MARKRQDGENEEPQTDATVEEALGGIEVPETPQAPNPWEVMARVADALEKLAGRAPQGGDESKAIEALTGALERMSSAQLEGARMLTEEQRKAHRPSNTVIPNISVFNRRGDLLTDYKKPKLKCRMLLPWEAEDESLTREEVELLNLLEPGDYVVRRADRTRITVNVQISYKADSITPHTLVINHETAFNNDNYRMVPVLSDMLRDMLKQHDRTVAMAASQVLTDEEEEALIEAGELSVSV